MGSSQIRVQPFLRNDFRGLRASELFLFFFVRRIRCINLPHLRAMSVTNTPELTARKQLIFTNVDRLMKCLHARYQKIAGEKSIYCELYVINRHTGREHIIAHACSNSIFIEQQDIPRGEQVAYDRAYKLAGDFFNNMAVFLHLAGEHKGGTDCDNMNYLNLVVNTETGVK